MPKRAVDDQMILRCQKAQFSLPDGLHYLNCAYMAPLSKDVEAAGVVGVRKKSNPSAIFEADFFEDNNVIRERFARLINVSDPLRVAIFPAVSYGIAVAASNTPAARGQNIVIAGEQFPSNVYAWWRHRDAGAELRVVARPQGDQVSASWNADVLEAIDGQTAIVALAHVHWTDGTKFDLDAVGRRAREVGAAFVVDGTQSVGAVPFDVQMVQPDAVIVGAYKWLMGPYGIAVGYLGSRYDDGVPLEEPWIVRAGSEDFRTLVDYQEDYRDGATRFDGGGMANFVTVPMLKTSLGQVLEWGAVDIQAYCTTLTGPLATRAIERGWAVEDPEGRAGHILGIRLPPTADFRALQRTLSDSGVAVSLRGQSVRISPHVYNHQDDVDALLEVLDEVLVGVA